MNARCVGLTTVLLWITDCTPSPGILVESPAPAVSDSPLIGCWSLSAPGIDHEYLRPPGGVRLVDSTYAQNGGLDPLILRFGIGVRHNSTLPRGGWQYFARDSAYVFWGDGLSGFTAVIKVREDSLTGSAQMQFDFGGPRPLVPLKGRRVSCAGPWT